MPNIDGAMSWGDFTSGYWIPLLQQDLVQGLVVFVVGIGFVTLLWRYLIGGMRGLIEDVSFWTKWGVERPGGYFGVFEDGGFVPGYSGRVDAEGQVSVFDLGWDDRIYNQSGASLFATGGPVWLEDDVAVSAYMRDGDWDD